MGATHPNMMMDSSVDSAGAFVIVPDPWNVHSCVMDGSRCRRCKYVCEPSSKQDRAPVAAPTKPRVPALFTTMVVACLCGYTYAEGV